MTRGASIATFSRSTMRNVLPPAISGQELSLLGVIAVLWILLTVFTPAFMSAVSMTQLLWRLAPVGIMAIGMCFVIVTGGIDISVAATLMVCSVTSAKLMVDSGFPFLLALIVAVVVGAILGALNGILITVGHVHAIIITFGTANLFRFIGLQLFNSKTVNGLPGERAILGPGTEGQTLGVPNAFLLMLLIAVVAWYYMRHFPEGRHYYAIGHDQTAASLAGVNVQRRVFLAYTLTGLLTGLAAAITIAGGTSTLDQNVGLGQELAVIAAVVIGGTSILGGRGSVFGAILGALLVQTVSTGVTQLGWPSQLTNLFIGVFILIAVGVDLVREHRRRRKAA